MCMCKIPQHFCVTCACAGVSPPQQLLAVTETMTFFNGSITQSYKAIDTVAINSISRLMYWYNNTVNSIMVQSLDGDDIWVSTHLLLRYLSGSLTSGIYLQL